MCFLLRRPRAHNNYVDITLPYYCTLLISYRGIADSSRQPAPLILFHRSSNWLDHISGPLTDINIYSN